MSNQFSLNGSGDGGHRSYSTASALVIRALEEEAVTWIFGFILPERVTPRY